MSRCAFHTVRWEQIWERYQWPLRPHNGINCRKDHHCTMQKLNMYFSVSQLLVSNSTMELDTKQNSNVSSLQSHWVLISEAGVWANRWHKMTSRPAATLPCQNISWLAFPAFLALFSKTLRNTPHLTLQPLFFLERYPQMAALSPPLSQMNLRDPHWPL